MTLIDRQWDAIREDLKQKFGSVVFHNWIRPLRLSHHTKESVYLEVPTRFMRDWIQTHYLETISALWTRTNQNVTHIEILVAAVPEAVSPRPAEKVADADFDSRFTLETFAVGKTNQGAYQTMRGIMDSYPIPSNMCFLYGHTGLGKTHLLQAVCRMTQDRHPDRRIVYVTAERFMSRFIDSVRQSDMGSFKSLFRKADILILDDFQFFAGKGGTLDEVCHTFNDLIGNKSQIIVSADKPPQALKIDPRLRSRLTSGLIEMIYPPEYELRMKILTLKAESLGARFSYDILSYLAYKVTANARELEGALYRLYAYQELRHQTLTLRESKKLIQSWSQTVQTVATIERIQEVVCVYFDLSLSQLLSQSREKKVVISRQLAMFLARELTEKSLAQIGQAFNGRDHTTVINALERVPMLQKRHQSVHQDLLALREKLEES